MMIFLGLNDQATRKDTLECILNVFNGNLTANILGQFVNVLVYINAFISKFKYNVSNPLN